MRRAGFATLIYESFVPRNYPRSGDGSGGTKLELNQVVDAYMALKALAANPRIDPKRIYYVGMSAEGNAALLATIEWIRKRYADNLQFAGLVALYPGGYAAPNAAGMSTETPLLILPAEQDNFMKWSRTKVWLDYVTRENPSLPIKVVMVKDTQHSFMHPNGAGYNPNTATPNNCPYLLVSERAPMAPMLQLDGSVVGYRWDQSCVARGATTSYSSSAAAFAIAQIVAFSNGEAARQDSLRSTLLKGKKAV